MIVMERAKFERMSVDDLYKLHLGISEVLKQKIQKEKLRLEERLKRLKIRVSRRRSYPPVPPKYCNPEKPSETWAGRGKQPRWLVAQLSSGKRIEDFTIQVRNRRRISDRRATSSRPQV